MKKKAIKMAINLIGEDSIKEGLKSVISGMVKKRDEFELQNDEIEVGAFIYMKENQPFIAVTPLNEHHKITRFLQISKLDDLAINALKNISEA